MNVIHFNDNTDDGLDHEDNFPDDENEMKKYLAAIKVENKSKHFSIKFKVTKPINIISKEVVGHMSTNKNYATIDTLGSKRVSCIGFWTVLHPDANNRRRLKSICETHLLATTGKNIDVSIYSRAITHEKNDDKAESRVIVIEVRSEDAQIVTDSLMNRSFTEYEGNCRFVPFMKMGSTYNSTMAKLIQSHADHIKSTERINIGDLFLGTVNVRFITENFKSLKSLLLSFNNETTPLIHDIDYAPNGSTNIIYNIKHDTHLEDFLTSIPTLLKTHVHNEDISSIYKNKISVPDVLRQRRVTNTQLTFWDDIEQSMQINPQDPSPPKPTYAAAATRHTKQSPLSGLPQDKRLLNMERSVTTIKQDYVSKDDVLKLIQDNQPAPSLDHLSSATVQSMIDTSMKAIPDPAPSMTQSDIITLIEEQTKKFIKTDVSIVDIQNKIDASITSLRDEFDTSQQALAKSVLAVSTTATNLQATVAALQDHNKHLIDMILKKKPNHPAISPKNEAGANI